MIMAEKTNKSKAKSSRMKENNHEKYIDLDECVLNALKLISESKLPKFSMPKFKRPLIVGSGNAAVTGKMLFEDYDGVFADESSYISKLKAVKSIDGAVLISASGGKHAPIIAKELKKKKIKTILITNNNNALAKPYCDKTIVYPKNIEPYTYNTSTYLSMIFSKTKEDAKSLSSYLNRSVRRKIPSNLKKYDSYFIIIPNRFENSKEMFLTKFDELFGSRISGRVFTEDEVKHAKTLVPNPKELFIGLGVDNKVWGDKENRINFSLQKNANYGSIIAEGYYIIGFIQTQNPPYFKRNVEKYTRDASKIFGQEIKPIVK